MTVKLDKIAPSPTNPRKHFDEAKLAELAESIQSKGVLQPILLRPTYRCDGAKKAHPDMRPELYWENPGVWPAMTFELVAGERRFRAAKLAGLVEIPATVRDLSDVQVLEVQVVENDQREDVTPLERADGYARLVEEHGVAVEDLAARVGKSPATIYGLLKIRNLPKQGKDALNGGELSMSTAQILCRIPSEQARTDAVEYAVTPNWSGGLPSFRDVKAYIERSCMIELKQASFSQKDANLTSAGACTSCPKRTGNNRDEYPDARADICTDPACYRDKEAAHRKILVSEARERGRKVLEGKAAEEALSYRSTYFDLKDQCHELDKPQSYERLVGKDLKEKVVIAVDGRGKVHQLVAKKDALPILKEKHGLDKNARANGKTPSKNDVEQKRREMRNRLIARKGMSAIVAQVEHLFGATSTLGMGEAQENILRLLCKQNIAVAWSETRRAIIGRRKIELDTKVSQYDRMEVAIEKYIDTLGKTQLFGLWAEIVCSREFNGGAYNPEEGQKRILTALGLDYAKIAAEAKEELAEKKAAKKKAAAEPAPQAKPAKSAQEELVEMGLLDSAQPASTAKDYDEALRRSLEQHFDNVVGWQHAQANGASDEALRDLIVCQWMRGRPAQSNMTSDLMVTVDKVLSWCRCKGKELIFWHDSLEPKGKPTLKGVEVLAEIRRLKEISQPKARLTDEAAAVDDACRVCHCTQAKFDPSGAYWVEPRLCSACVRNGAEPDTEDGKEQAAVIRHAHEARKLKGVLA